MNSYKKSPKTVHSYYMLFMHSYVYDNIFYEIYYHSGDILYDGNIRL